MKKTRFLGWMLSVVFLFTLEVVWAQTRPHSRYPGRQSLFHERIRLSPQCCRRDPIFRSPVQLYTPLLFAHRGGRLEAPESTRKAFNHAIRVGADVLELDVQLTAEGKIVVWHGPGLDNVYIEGVHPDPQKRRRGRRRIDDFYWKELKGKAWVVDPGEKILINALDYPDKEDRELMLLSEFLESFPNAPLNIELKGTIKNNDALSENVGRFIEILKAGQKNRTIVVVSGNHKILKEFRTQSDGHFSTGLSALEQLFISFLPKTRKKPAFETTYDRFWTSDRRIQKIRDLDGATYVFITGFGPIPALDGEDFDPENLKHLEKLEKKIAELLDRGIDGIMTDRPKTVKSIMDRWILKTGE